MIISDATVLALLAAVVAGGLVIIALIILGVVLVVRGRWIWGGGLVVLIVGALAGPGGLDRLQNIPARADLDARQRVPDALDLRGLSVLFIETGTTVCAGICADVVRIGTEVEAHWVGLGTYYPEALSQTAAGSPTGAFLADFEVLPEQVVRVALGPQRNDPQTQRILTTDRPGDRPGVTQGYDAVIFHDTEGLLSFYAPHLIGGALPARVDIQDTTLVFTSWPDPFTTPPPEPTWRLVQGRLVRSALLPMPFADGGVTHPSLEAAWQLWREALCPFAGPAEARDGPAHTVMCLHVAVN